MRAVLLLLACQCGGFGTDISGLWVAKHAPTHSPVAIQIEQAGSRLIIVKIVASGEGRHLERDEYDLGGGSARSAAVRPTRAGTEIVLRGGEEIWTIASNGELVIRRRQSADRLIFERARDRVEASGVRT